MLIGGSVAIEAIPTIKLTSFMLLCVVIGAVTAHVILQDTSRWWVTIPAVALFGFAAYRTTRTKVEREQVLFAILLASLLVSVIRKLME